MKITFYSSFLNHHQLYFCMEMIKILGDNFTYVATERISNDRLIFGYKDMNKTYKFVVRSYENKSLAYKLAESSDIVIVGSAPKKYFKKRLKDKSKITFLYSERIFKNGIIKNLLRMIYYKFIKERYQNDNYYLLCASAYSASDYNSIGLFKNKSLKWGYFPDVKKYKNIKNLIKRKQDGSILWVGRFEYFKHPEVCIEIAKRLKKDGVNFKIEMIGNGSLYSNINNAIIENNLQKEILLLGSMSPEEVRKHMEKSKIFIFSSDRGEGWGAVLNEAMNSACAVIASHAIGSVPFLIKNHDNGIIYKDGDINELYFHIKELLYSKELIDKIGESAYNSLYNLWNAKTAASRLVELSSNLLDNKIVKYKDGPCSEATQLKDGWYVGEKNEQKNKKKNRSIFNQ